MSEQSNIDNVCALVQPPLLFGMTLPGAATRAAAWRRPPPTAIQQRPCITHIDRAMIRLYFRPHQTGLAPPLGKPCAIDRRVPSSLQPRCLPDDLEQKLSAVPAGYRRVVVGSNLMLVEIASGVVVDVVKNIDDTSLA